MKKAGVHARGRIDCHLDVAEAWAAFEPVVLDARSAILGYFESFDPTMPLMTARAQAFGATWHDLVMHTIRRGVDVSFTLNVPLPGGVPPCPLATPAGQSADAPPGSEAQVRPRRPGRLQVRLLGHPARADAGLRRLFGVQTGHRVNLAVVDGKTLLLARRPPLAGDARSHLRELSMIARGPAAQEAQDFLLGLEQIVSGQAEPSPARRLLRTIARPRRAFAEPAAVRPPRGEPARSETPDERDLTGSLGARLARHLGAGWFGAQTVANEIESAHHMLLRRAEQLIYIETQGFDCLSLARQMALRAAAAPRLGVILILPAEGRAVPSRAERRCLSILSQALGARLFVGLAPGGCTNVSVFDDEAAIAGTADLRMAALRRDSHVSLLLRRNDGVAQLRRRLMRHWLAADARRAASAADEAFPSPEESLAAFRAGAFRAGDGAVLLRPVSAF